jgi:hypothetical protein
MQTDSSEGALDERIQLGHWFHRADFSRLTGTILEATRESNHGDADHQPDKANAPSERHRCRCDRPHVNGSTTAVLLARLVRPVRLVRLPALLALLALLAKVGDSRACRVWTTRNSRIARVTVSATARTGALACAVWSRAPGAAAITSAVCNGMGQVVNL